MLEISPDKLQKAFLDTKLRVLGVLGVLLGVLFGLLVKNAPSRRRVVLVVLELSRSVLEPPPDLVLLVLVLLVPLVAF